MRISLSVPRAPYFQAALFTAGINLLRSPASCFFIPLPVGSFPSAYRLCQKIVVHMKHVWHSSVAKILCIAHVYFVQSSSWPKLGCVGCVLGAAYLLWQFSRKKSHAQKDVKEEQVRAMKNECEALNTVNNYLTEKNIYLAMQLAFFQGVGEKVYALLTETKETNDLFLPEEKEDEEEDMRSFLYKTTVREFGCYIDSYLFFLEKEMENTHQCNEEFFTFLQTHRPNVCEDLREVCSHMRKLGAQRVPFERGALRALSQEDLEEERQGGCSTPIRVKGSATSLPLSPVSLDEEDHSETASERSEALSSFGGRDLVLEAILSQRASN